MATTILSASLTQALALALGFKGEIETPEGLVHLRSRDYDPATGQFVSADLMAGVQGATTIANPYHYADNDPINRSDPMGLMSTDDRLEMRPHIEPTLTVGYGGYTSAGAVLAAVDKRELSPARLMTPPPGLYQKSNLDLSDAQSLGALDKDDSSVQGLLNYYGPFLPYSYTKTGRAEVFKVKGRYSYGTYKLSDLKYDGDSEQYYTGDSSLSYASGRINVEGYLVFVTTTEALVKSVSPEPKGGPGVYGDPSLGTPDEFGLTMERKRIIFYPSSLGAWGPLPASDVQSADTAVYHWWTQ